MTGPSWWNQSGAVAGFEARSLGALAGAEARVERLAGWLVDRRLGTALGVVAAAWLATWLPHYLTWPWWTDLDTFAAMAQAWDAGERPFREIRAYNFPGQTYVFWLLGRTIGWGRPTAVYVLDSALLLALIAALVGWSRSLTGRSRAGWAAALAVLWYYLGLDYARVAQRDWHGSVLAVLGLLWAEVRPGRAGRLGAALLWAAAATFRPHVVLFLPALASAVVERSGGSRRESARALIETALAMAAGLALAFAPLALAGVLGDFVESLRRVGSGQQGYGRFSVAVMREKWLEGLLQPETLLVLPGLALLWARGPAEIRPAARTWLLATAGVLCYQPLHPIDHAYLDLPLILVRAVGFGLMYEAAARASGWPSLGRLLLLAWVLHRGLTPSVPAYCGVRWSLEGARSLLAGRMPADSPPGSLHKMDAAGGNATWYTWPDYCAALEHLRATTGPGTRVANLLKNTPFPPFNGPVGRLPVFPAESGILWLWWGNPDLEDQFVAALERADDSVVVWAPEERHMEFHPELTLDKLNDAVRRLYRPEARFGRFEIWRRRRPAP